MTKLERANSHVPLWRERFSGLLGGLGMAALALLGGAALSAPAQAASGTFNGAASLQVDGLCTAASSSSFGASFTATYQSADAGSSDTYSLFLLDGTNTIIGSSSQSVSAAAYSSTSTISVPTTQTPSDGSAYTLVAYNQNTGSPLYAVGDVYEVDSYQMATLGFDASALDDSCPGPNSARVTPSISGPAGPVNAAFTATITFDGDVTLFTVDDLVVGNGAASAFAGSGDSYSATITPTTDGDVTVDIASGAAVDGGTTETNAAPTFTVAYDATAPSAQFVDVEPDTTIEGPISVQLEFSEAVSGVAAGQVTVTNGAISGFTEVSSQLYSFTLTPDPGLTGAGVVLIYSAGQATDLAGNANLAAADAYTANTNVPSVVISTSEVEPVAGAFVVDVVFNETVTGFDTGDFVAGDFTVDSVAGSGTTYTATLTPTNTGTLSIKVAAATVIDADTNANTESNTLSVEADITDPTVVIATSASSPVAAAFTATFTFSKPVTGFTVDDLVLTNATASGFSGSGAEYSATIQASASGTVKVDVPGASAQDTGARDNVAATTLTVQADAVAPTVTLTSSAVGPVSAPFTLNLDFSEAYSGFTIADLVVVNGVATNIQRAGDDLTATITPTATGTLTVDVAGGAFQDTAGNNNTAATQFTIESTADGAPTVVIATTSASPVGGSFPVTVTFSEAVTGFLFTDVLIVNGTTSNESISGNVYSFDVVPSVDGPVTVDVPAGVAQDGDLNDNLAATQLSLTADVSVPTVAITSAAVGPVAGSFDVTLTFSEAMDRVVASTLTVGNGAVTAISGSDAVYVATISPTIDGTVTVDIAADAATDLAGNGNTAATQFSIAAVLGSPTLVISGPAGPVSDAFTATFTFSENVTGFELSDIVVGNGSASALAGAGAVYTATIIPDADGAVTVDVAAAVAQNGGGVNNSGATQYSVTAASLGPVATITSTTPVIVAAGFVQILVEFDEAVSGLDIGDFNVTGVASTLAFGGSGTSYSFFVNATNAADVVVSLPAATVTADSGGAANRQGPDLTIPLFTSPTVVISSAAADPVTGGTFDITVTFSESVTGFESGDLVIDGGAVSAFSGSGAVYAATVAPIRDGTLTIDIASSAATGAAGGVSTAAPQFSIGVNQDVPQPVITSVSSGTVSGAFDITVNFDEPVTGFDVTDLTVGNGAASNFAGSGTAYTATITPAADGLVTVDIAAAAAVDADAGDSLVATQFTITNDETGATPSFSTAAADPFSGSFVLDVTFDEDVTGFAASDLTVGNGTASGLSGSGSAYTVTITPAASGLVTVDMDAGKVEDIPGNPNLVATQFTITADITAPSGYAVTLDQDPITAATASAVSFSFTGFEVGALLDYTISSDGGGASVVDSATVSAAAATVSGIDISGLGDGTITLSATLTDPLGNAGAAVNDTATKDTVDPTVVLSSVATDPVAGGFTLDVVFSEPVTGFALGDLTVGNGVASALAGAGDTYSVTITPSADGLVTVDLAAAAAQDAAGNDNTAATQFSITRDATAPTLVLSTVSSDPVSGAFTLDVVFSESVTGFVVGDLTVGNGVASAFAGSGDTYSATITPSANGAVTVDVAAGAASDPAGNVNLAATQFSITNDETAPTVVLSSVSSDPVSGAFTLDIVFSESVTGFAIGDLTVGNGSASAFAGSGDTYSATITPAADGAVTIDLAAAAAQDSAGNTNTAATQFSITNDETGPSVVLSTAAADPVSGAFTLDIVFSETVTGFTIGDLTVGNGAASAFAGAGDTYSATITPSADGAVTIDVAAAAAQDSAGNANTAATQFSITRDATAPTLVLSSVSSDPVSGAFTLDVVFSESVTGFAIGDLTVGNGAASAFAGSGDTYSATITPAADGAVTVDVAGGAASDAAGNANLAAPQFSITSDSTLPSVVLSSSATDPVSGAFTLDVVFSESVTGFTIGDLTVGNGAASAFAGSGDTYSATITPAGDGTVTVDLAAAAAQDSAGNDNSAAIQFSITSDGTAPTVALSTVSADPVSGTFTLDVVFSESVSGFTIADLTVANGAASAFAGTGDTYSATITPAADGAVTVDIAAGAAQDSAGNDNLAATQFSITFDATAPTVVLSTASADPVSGAFTLDIVFSESVTGFAIGDLTVGNGAASAFAGSGDTYSATITPSADGVVTVDVAAAAAQDVAGNDNTAATQFSITSDGSAPTITQGSRVTASANGGITNADTLVATVTFSEAVVNISGDDFVATGISGAVISVSGSSGTSVTVTITGGDLADLDGSVELGLAPGQDIADAAGNQLAGPGVIGNAAWSIDNTAPVATMTSAATDPVTGAFTLNIAFDESIAGSGNELIVGELVISNGLASNFQPQAANSYSVTITPVADGPVTVDIPAGVALDYAGNLNLASAQFSITADSTAPTLAITGPSAAQTGAFTATFTFSESVSGFALGDIAVGNGTASALAGSGAVYTATVTPAADGTVTIDVAASVATDAAGNNNTAATQFAVAADLSLPTVVSVVVSDANLTVGDVGTSFTVAATFSEALDTAIAPVFAFVGADLSATLSLQSAAWSSGDTVYTASYDLLDSGIKADDIDITVSGAADLAGNLLADATTTDLFSVELRRGGITIAQTVDGAVDGEFDFTGDLGAFSIATTGQTGSQSFADLAEGVYTITPAAEDGFGLDGATCSGGSTSIDPTTGAVTITLAPADDVSCTFNAIADPAIDETVIPEVTLALDSAIDDPTGVSTSFSLTNTGGLPFSFTAGADVTWLDIDPTSGEIPADGALEFTITFNDGVLDLAPGTYTANVTITETSGAAQKPAGSSANTLNVLTIPVTITLAPREGTLTIVATTAPSEAGDGVFNYTSTLADLNGLSLSTTGGTASSGALTVLRGSYSLTQAASEGWALDSMSCTGDTDGGSTFDLDSGTIVLDIDPEEAMVCTFANRRDEDFIREITQSAIRSFMAARADQILTNSPELASRIRGSRMTATPNRFAADYQDGRFSADMSTSLSAIRQAAEGSRAHMPGDEQFNLDGETGIASLDVWAQAIYTSIDDNRAGLNANSTFGLYYLGVDMMASENVLVGALLQWDHAETVTGTYRSEVSGDGWMAGPYVAARLSENVYLDARGAWGRSENDVNPIGLYTDAFETSRWLVEANLSGEMHSGNWRLSPQIGIAYFNEEQDAYTDTLGFLIPSQEITLGRINAGPELAYRFVNAEGGYFEPYVRLTALWDYDDADVYNSAGNLQGIGGLRADARFGLTAQLPNGGMISGELGIIGLGLGEFEANNAMIRIRMPLSME
ncbi:Ig-like domain-containing protein [Maricaulis sp.]|uniref:Ig-like domain-containing protein n=1 Tax=Maricaulis sp. TaxID=1486257 RepID=UPI003A93F77C